MPARSARPPAQPAPSVAERWRPDAGDGTERKRAVSAAPRGDLQIGQPIDLVGDQQLDDELGEEARL